SSAVRGGGLPVVRRFRPAAARSGLDLRHLRGRAADAGINQGFAVRLAWVLHRPARHGEPAMKPILTTVLAVAALAATAAPVEAQNAGQIARVRGGASCAGCNLFQGDFSGLQARGLNLSGAR